MQNYHAQGSRCSTELCANHIDKQLSKVWHRCVNTCMGNAACHRDWFCRAPMPQPSAQTHMIHMLQASGCAMLSLLDVPTPRWTAGKLQQGSKAGRNCHTLVSTTPGSCTDTHTMASQQRQLTTLNVAITTRPA
jgi:hypothetical protein